MHVESKEVLHRLETLDDTIFAAINGDTAALAVSNSHWQEVVEAIGHELVEESREQYLRYASVVRQSLEDENGVSSEQISAALDIITMLTK